MVTIGVDPHKETHRPSRSTSSASELAGHAAPAAVDGFGKLLAWARGLDQERVWVIEDCRHVSGPLERFLLDHGETRRSPPAAPDGRRATQRRASAGSPIPIDALAVARAALREGPRASRPLGWPGPSSRSACSAVHRDGWSTPHPLDQRSALAAARPLARLGDPRPRARSHPGLQQQVARASSAPSRPVGSGSLATYHAGSAT